MPRLRDLRITSPLYCEMLVRVFGDSEHIAENMTAVQTLYLGGYTDGADTCERAKAILPAILARFASANTFTISDRRRRAGPLPLGVMQNCLQSGLHIAKAAGGAFLPDVLENHIRNAALAIKVCVSTPPWRSRCVCVCVCDAVTEAEGGELSTLSEAL